MVPYIESEDIHLGDNVYPDSWGTNHNPLHSEIYDQSAKGLIYFDKESLKFFAGRDQPTRIVAAFARRYAPRIEGLDFSAFRFVSAYEPGAPVPATLRQYVDAHQSDRFAEVGPTILYTNSDDSGGFYERYAALGVCRAVDFTIPLAKAGLKFSAPTISKVEFLIEAYHGGIRVGQPAAFELTVNQKSISIQTRSSDMRSKETITLTVPLDALKFDTENVVSVSVLPWEESGPKSLRTNKGPVHFRDVGIVNAYFQVYEK